MLAGATTIIAVDIDPKKLEWAKSFGATHTVNPKEVDAIAAIKEITGGNGANYTFEAVGKTLTLEQALYSRDLAGTCVFIWCAPGPTLTLELQRFFDIGGKVAVSWYGDCLPTRDFPMLADWYKRGQLNLDGIVSRTISLEEVDDAFAAMERGETLRSVIIF
ncbi:MAG: zinc-binding dehydrogenase [Caldilineaceae bacterium]